MKTTISMLFAALSVAGLLAVGIYADKVRTSVGQVTGRTVLTLGHGLDTAHPVHIAMEFMAKRLAELSGGTVELHIYPGSMLGSETESIEQVRNGALAMTKISVSALENFEPIYSVFGMPYLFRDETHYWQVLNGQIGLDMLHKAVSKKLLGLCYYDAGTRNFYTVNKPIMNPDDIKGLKLRVMSSRTAIRMVECFGGAPTPISWGELYTSLGQGTVVGAENNLPSFTSNRHYEVCKHFTRNAHAMIPDILCMSTDIWDKLSPEIQGWIKQAAADSCVYQRELWNKMTLESEEKAKAEGVTIYEVDTKVFAEKVRPMYDEIKDEDMLKLITGIREVK